MAVPTLKIPSTLKVEDAKNPNISAAPSERDCVALSVLDRTGSMLEKYDIDTSMASAKDEVSSPRSPAVLVSPKPKESSYRINQFANLRTNFIKKVLAILILQLTITVGSVALTFVPELGVRDFMRSKPIILIVTGIVGFVTLLILICKRNVCRRVPINYLLLFVYTSCMSYMVGCLSALTSNDTVLLAGISTIAIVIAITAYTCLAKQNSTNTGMRAVSFATTLLLIGIFWLTYSSPILSILYSVLVAFIFGMHLASDIRSLVGKYEQRYSLDDYILASLDIYIDIIQIFVIMLELLRRCSTNIRLS